MVDTTFCIDLLREHRKKTEGSASRKLKLLGPVRLQMSLFVYCELLQGVNGSASPAGELSRVETLAEFLPVVLPELSFTVFYGQAAASLANSGEPIPQMDLLIGAHAASLGLPLLTRDARHFKRIGGLVAETY